VGGIVQVSDEGSRQKEIMSIANSFFAGLIGLALSTTVGAVGWALLLRFGNVDRYKLKSVATLLVGLKQPLLLLFVFMAIHRLGVAPFAFAVGALAGVVLAILLTVILFKNRLVSVSP
jgi:hypothetical protein